LTETNTENPKPSDVSSISAAYPVMMPACSSRRMRRATGVGLRPIRWARSLIVARPSLCRARRIAASNLSNLVLSMVLVPVHGGNRQYG